MDGEAGGFRSEITATLPPGCTPDAVTSDGHVVAFWPQPDGRLRFTWDGVAGEPFDQLFEMRDKTPAVFTSDDGAHLAYVAGRGEHVFVGRDAGEDPPMHAFSRSVPPVFSRAGVHLAYGSGADDREFRLVVDGAVVSELPIAPIAAVFSPDGERLAYAECRVLTKDFHEFRIVLDGEAGPWFDGLRNNAGAMQFSPDSRRFAYFRVDGEGHCQWIVDGVAQRWSSETPVVSLARIRHIAVLEPPLVATFSPDSRRFAYFADVVEKGVAIIEDDAPGPVFNAVGMPVFSPDSRHLAYLAQTFAKQLIVVADGTPGPEWTGTWGGTPVFSPDSRRVAVTIGREEGSFLRKRHRQLLTVDGGILAEVAGDDVSLEPVFSPRGDRIAWWVRRGEIIEMMVNAAPHSRDVIASSGPIFTSAGHLVYAAITVPDGMVTIMIDDRPGPLADVLLDQQSLIALFANPRIGRPTLPFAISPDGEHVAWAGIFGEESRPVVDHHVGPSFEQVLAWTFDADGTARWWAQRDREIWTVTAHPAGI